MLALNESFDVPNIKILSIAGNFCIASVLFGIQHYNVECSLRHTVENCAKYQIVRLYRLLRVGTLVVKP